MSKKISANRYLMSVLIAILFVGLVLVTEFADRLYSAILLCIIIGICVLETRYAMGTKIPQQFDALIWIYAILFGVPYFLFGYVGVVLFTLLIFIIGVTVAVINNHSQWVLQNFAFILVYPALLLSTLLYINRSEASRVTEQVLELEAHGLIEKSVMGDYLLPYNTVGLALVFGVSCLSDVFALVFGVLFGKRKLAPDISPNKTVEGAIGGLVGGIIGAGLVFLLFEGLPLMGIQLFRAGLPVDLALGYKILDYCLIGIFGSCCTQIGDLLASWVKRECGVKDYSRLLGSHGGFMDRFDGIMLNSVFVSVIYLFIL